MPSRRKPATPAICIDPRIPDSDWGDLTDTLFVMLSTLIDYAGRLHPLVVHFPIALLLVGAAGEIVRLRRDSEFLGRFIAWVVLLGAGAALFAAGTGWLFAYQIHRPPELRPFLAWHRWLGLLAVVVAFLAAWAAHLWVVTPVPRRRWLRRILIWSAAGLVSATAHLGALLVWGTDFFS